EKVVRGRIHTVDGPVLTPAEKAELFRKTGALAVDMESTAIRAAAQQAGVPFIAIRAISDAADEAIDPAVLNLVDPYGKARAWAVFSTLLRRPRLLAQLLRLRA